MTLFNASLQAFNIAAVLYAIAFLLYAGSLASEKPLFTSGGSWMGRIAWLTHTTALILRWVHAGAGHPPWTNLYESLVFFSWGTMGANLFLEIRFGFKITGVFATAVTFVALGIASLHPNKEIEPLVPALQSWWLFFHVFMACIAYAFFLAASFFGVFYLLKDRVKLEVLAGFAALVCALFLAIAAGKSFFVGEGIQFFKIVQLDGKDFIDRKNFVALPYASHCMALLLAFYTAAAVSWLALKKDQIGWTLLWIAFAVHAGLLVDIATAPKLVEGLAVKSNPYRTAAVIMTFGLTAFYMFMHRFKKQVLAKLPDEGTLDRLQYESILLGVPFMTLNLVSGGVWAYYAWGRYWGWDPKETWAFITWTIYVIYMHMRILGGWKGRRTAIVAVIGFFVVIFTYLGVNLVISGLHSYATA